MPYQQFYFGKKIQKIVDNFGAFWCNISVKLVFFGDFFPSDA
jgi:uncharacterized glyoxalase superfamily protein PhnB